MQVPVNAVNTCVLVMSFTRTNCVCLYLQCLLVQGFWARATWGFPKGKVNEDEAPDVCAVREVGTMAAVATKQRWRLDVLLCLCMFSGLGCFNPAIQLSLLLLIGLRRDGI